MSSHWLDIIGAGASVAILVAYHFFLRFKLRHDPHYTVQAVNALARKEWVRTIMGSPNKDILAVQTLRNAIMGPTFLASTAVLLIIGVLTLSAQGDKLSDAWHALNLFGSRQTELWTGKLMLLLMDFFVAFFAFALAIRMFVHVGFMINVPLELNHDPLAPERVAQHLNRAGKYHTIGMRAYYFAVPLVFWMFGPHMMLLSTIVMVALLFHVDRAPRTAADEPVET